MFPGTWVETVAFNGHDISLIGVAGPDLTTIQAPSPADPFVLKILLGETIILEGFTIAGAMVGLRLFNSDVIASDCRFTGNGRAVFLEPGGGTFARCIFDHNGGSGVSGTSAGSLLQFEWCLFEDNTGAGVQVFGHNIFVDNCRFLSNGQTGMVVNTSSNPAFQPRIRNSLFANNDTSGIYIQGGSDFDIINVTAANNGVYGIEFGNIGNDLRNSILWGNGVEALHSPNFEGIDVAYCLIEGGYPGAAFGFTGDPMLDDDYRLIAGSPCIDSGSNSAAFGFTEDLYGDPRFVNAATPDCPQPGADCGRPPVIDMGATEHVARRLLARGRARGNGHARHGKPGVDRGSHPHRMATGTQGIRPPARR